MSNVKMGTGRNHKKEEAVVVGKTYDYILWMMQKVEKFPRSYKFTLGDRIVESSLDLLLNLVEAAYSKNKREYLIAANRDLNLLRFLLRLSKDLKILSIKSYEFVSSSLHEIGSMSGGWLKSEEKKKDEARG